MKATSYINDPIRQTFFNQLNIMVSYIIHIHIYIIFYNLYVHRTYANKCVYSRRKFYWCSQNGKYFLLNQDKWKVKYLYVDWNWREMQCKIMLLGNKRIITIWQEIYFHSVVYSNIYVRDVKYAHTHTECFLWGCKVFGLDKIYIYMK